MLHVGFCWCRIPLANVRPFPECWHWLKLHDIGWCRLIDAHMPYKMHVGLESCCVPLANICRPLCADMYDARIPHQTSTDRCVQDTDDNVSTHLTLLHQCVKATDDAVRPCSTVEKQCLHVMNNVGQPTSNFSWPLCVGQSKGRKATSNVVLPLFARQKRCGSRRLMLVDHCVQGKGNIGRPCLALAGNCV